MDLTILLAVFYAHYLDTGCSVRHHRALQGQILRYAEVKAEQARALVDRWIEIARLNGDEEDVLGLSDEDE